MSNCETPLHLAVRSFDGDVSPIKLLLEHDDSDVNVGDSKGETPVHLAVQNVVMWNCRPLVELLLEHKADINAVNLDGNTPLHLAVMVTLIGADVGLRDVVLLDHGADVDAVNANGDTPLHLAVQNVSDYSIGVNELLEHGSDVNIPNLNGDTPFHLYMQNEAYKFIHHLRKFLEKTRDVNAANSKGETPLHFIVRNKTCKVEYIKAFLEYGADVGKRNAQGENAYQAYCSALEKDDRKADRMIEVLLRSNYSSMDSSLHVACLFHNVDAVRELLRNGADPNATGDFEYPPLFYALNASGDVDKASTIRLMLDYGADFNRRVSYWYIHDTVLIVGFHGVYTTEREDNWAVRKIFLEHVVKLLALDEKRAERGIGFDARLNQHNRDAVHAQLRRTLDHTIITDYNDWLSRSCLEVKAMSETEIGTSRLSFLDLLLAGAKETAISAKNKELVKAFQENKAQFPMYLGMLDAKLARELERRKLIDRSAVVLSEALKFADPGDEFFETVLSYCSNEDLMHVIAIE